MFSKTHCPAGLQAYLSGVAQAKRISTLSASRIRLAGQKLTIPDTASFLFTYPGIFEKEIYRFPSDKKQPVIIDGGANIGLSVIYFKKLFPQAKIIAFEPDKQLFPILSQNVASFGFSDVELVNKGLWNETTTLSFFSEGADSGSIQNAELDNTTVHSIETVQLRDYLTFPEVDFLKLDIEGAETNVLLDIESRLPSVRNLFIEYHSFIGQPQTLDVILRILTRHNFRYYLSTFGCVGQPRPYIQPASYNNMDVQLNIFAVRQKQEYTPLCPLSRGEVGQCAFPPRRGIGGGLLIY
ncbi:MAG: FkbM family methyltransferase [Sphingobacteriales bacterium]|nr:FkbM family methyltransferase [Sphingobacteriales bacterium]